MAVDALREDAQHAGYAELANRARRDVQRNNKLETSDRRKTMAASTPYGLMPAGRGYSPRFRKHMRRAHIIVSAQSRRSVHHVIYALLDRAEPEHPDHVERQIHPVEWGC